jgi:hypothetical protein
MTRRVLTRDGLIALKTPVSTLGITREERTTAMIAGYVDGLDPGLRGPMRDVYVRAYRRAGLLDGDPDEFTGGLPVEPKSAEEPSDASDTAQASVDTGKALNEAHGAAGGQRAGIGDDAEGP